MTYYGRQCIADGQKEDDAAHLVALWDSWFYRSWKSDMAMVHLLEDNYKYLLCNFRKFSYGGVKNDN